MKQVENYMGTTQAPVQIEWRTIITMLTAEMVVGAISFFSPDFRERKNQPHQYQEFASQMTTSLLIHKHRGRQKKGSFLCIVTSIWLFHSRYVI